MTHWIMNQDGSLINLDKSSAVFIDECPTRFSEKSYRVMCDGDSFDYTLGRFDSREDADEFMWELLERLEK